MRYRMKILEEKINTKREEETQTTEFINHARQ